LQNDGSLFQCTTLRTIYPVSHHNIPEDLNLFFRQLIVINICRLIFYHVREAQLESLGKT